MTTIRMIPPKTAENIALSLFCTMAAIQVLVALGALPVNILWGGSQEKLTLSLRLASLMACLILLGMAAIIRRRNQPQAPDWIRMTSWGIVGYMVLNTAGNLSSTNPMERYAFGTLTAVLAFTSAVVASTPESLEESLAGTSTAAYESIHSNE